MLFVATVLLVLAAIEGGYRLAVFRKRQSDLERVNEGALQVSQQPMIALDRKLEASAL